jgi:hypothetical protein
MRDTAVTKYTALKLAVITDADRQKLGISFVVIFVDCIPIWWSQENCILSFRFNEKLINY